MLRAVSSALVRERNVRRLLDEVIDILHREMGMLRGSITLLEGDELRIEASSRMLNAEERALGRYRIGEGITGLVAKTGRAEVIMDIRKDKRFLNRTKSRKVDEPLSYICVPLVHLGQVIGTLSVDREMRGAGSLFEPCGQSGDDLFGRHQNGHQPSMKTLRRISSSRQPFGREE